MIIGYARVSTDEQHLDLQIDALKEKGCDPIFTDNVSAVSKARTGFENALKTLKSGDTLVIWKMDRAFRSLRHALDTLEYLEQNDIQFQSLTDMIDTTTPMGKCMYQIRNVFAELERNLIRERTRAGMAAAKRRGKKLGRPRKLTKRQIKWAKQQLKDNPQATYTSLAKRLKVSTATLRRAI